MPRTQVVEDPGLVVAERLAAGEREHRPHRWLDAPHGV